MKNLIRFGVAFESGLLKQFDKYIAGTAYVNRSEALRDLVRVRLMAEQVKNPDAPAMGVLTMVYDHHQRELEDHLTEVQHHHHHEVISTTHVHIDHDRCLEVILLRGTVRSVQDLSTSIAKFKGILHHSLTITPSGNHE